MFKLFTGSALIRAVGASSQVLMTLVISRECGLRQAGVVFFGYSLVMIVSTMARAGTELSALRVISQAYEQTDMGSVRSSAHSRLLLVGATSGVFAVLVILGAPWLGERSVGLDATASLRWAAAAMPAFAVLGLFSEFLKGVQRAWVGLLVQNVATPPALVVVPIVVLSRASDAATVNAVICGATWAATFATLVYWHRTTGGCSAGWLRGARGEVGLLLRDVPTLLVVSATPVIMQWVGAILLGFLTTPTQVAGYSVAARLAIAVSVVHSAASSVVAPRMAIAHGKGDLRALHQVTVQTGLLISGVTWPILIVMGVTAPYLLGIFGAGYGAFGSSLRVLLIGQIVASLIGHSGMVLVMTGKYSDARLNSLIAALSLVGLAFVFVPLAGADGAAFSMSGSVVLGHLAGLLLVRQRVGFWTVPTSRHAIRMAMLRVRPLRSTS
ncbi:lipopolysaccharide biosynthesis protein [Streptomyces sp. NPDC056653]|uniref:lipopolysaccharide biosynthesis protein n=1 Tax=Streptomyces sp. NPDC056653 TaxID=3345894 RepID=UPI0036BF7DD8